MRRMIDGKNIQFLEDMSKVMTYNSSTNTTEIGSNLEVNGYIKTNDFALTQDDGLELYNDSLITFYLMDYNSKNV